jgi:transposase-like protein
LSGVIEVDETFVGGTKHDGRRGRGASGKSLVLIAVQREDKILGRIRLKRISDASGQTLEKAINETIESGSIIRTDGWAGYSKLGEAGYKHEVVRADTSVGENLLPGCNLVASLMKRWLGGTLQGAVAHEHLEYYLDEYTFRFNRRTSRHRGKLFYRLLQQAVITDVVTYSGIKKGIRGRKVVKYNF